jgi:hypothetical protein
VSYSNLMLVFFRCCEAASIPLARERAGQDLYDIVKFKFFYVFL